MRRGRRVRRLRVEVVAVASVLFLAPAAAFGMQVHTQAPPLHAPPPSRHATHRGEAQTPTWRAVPVRPCLPATHSHRRCAPRGSCICVGWAREPCQSPGAAAAAPAAAGRRPRRHCCCRRRRRAPWCAAAVVAEQVLVVVVLCVCCCEVAPAAAVALARAAANPHCCRRHGSRRGVL